MEQATLYLNIWRTPYLCHYETISYEGEVFIMKKLVLLLTLLIVGMLNFNYADAKDGVKTIGKFRYEYVEVEDGIWIAKITPKSDKGISTLKIPAKLDGKKVVELGGYNDEPLGEDDTNIFGVTYAEEGPIKLIPKRTDERVEKIKKICIPSTVKRISKHCFSKISDGKIINIPKNVSKNVEWLTEIRWKKLTISPKNKTYKVRRGCLLSKDGKTIRGFVQKRKKVTIPKTVRTIATVCVSYHGVSTIIIPKSVTKIEGDGFTISSKVTIKVAKGNKKYAAKHGCLYNKKTGRLVTACAPDGVFRIPEGVTYATSYYVENGVRIDDMGIHRVGGVASKMIVPKSMKKIESLLDFSAADEFTCVMKGKIPPKLIGTVSNNVKKLTVYVPKGAKSAYEKAWEKEFKYYSSLIVTYIEQE